MSDGNTQSQDGQSWKQMYQVALLELDPKLVPQRIADAQKAVGERALELLRKNEDSNSETEALANAHLALDDLKRIHQAQ